jgi:hypothetical protein
MVDINIRSLTTRYNRSSTEILSFISITTITAIRYRPNRFSTMHLQPHTILLLFLSPFLTGVFAFPPVPNYISFLDRPPHKPYTNKTKALLNLTLEAGFEASIQARKASPVNVPNVKMPSNLPSLPGGAGIPGLVGGGVGTGAECPAATTNNQSNQCSSGVPYCCSPDGAGGTFYPVSISYLMTFGMEEGMHMLTRTGHNCQNSTVSCQQTVICCNNFQGVCLPLLKFCLEKDGRRC